MGRVADIILGILVLLALLVVAGRYFFRRAQRADDPPRLISKWIISAILLGFAFHLVWSLRTASNQFEVIAEVLMAASCGIVLGIIWAPNLGEMVAKPLADLYDGGNQEGELRPMYSKAEALRKKGCYAEAEAEVRQQLAAFPRDFQGTLLLAEIQAECLHDFPAAQATLESLLGQPDQSPDHQAYALNRLSDWQLKFNRDAAGARTSLERIVQSFPGTELAQIAYQRLAHLRAPEQGDPTAASPPVALPHSEERLGLREDFSGLQLPAEDVEATVSKLLRQLEQFPQDWEAREQLAWVYAGHYQRLDLAIDQLEQLLAQPGQPAKQVVHWLNMQADLQVKYGPDSAGVRATLNRIIQQFPRSAAAEAAQNRLARINLEFKAKQVGTAIKLGTYEQNMGLKAGGPPPRPR
jgi:hypothetical protein